MNILEGQLKTLLEMKSRVFPGKVAFTLHDTYGFPLDLTQDVVAHHGMTVDVSEFSQEMECQRERSRAARAGDVVLILQNSVTPCPTEFKGYEAISWQSEVIGLFDSKRGDRVGLLWNGSSVSVSANGILCGIRWAAR